MEKNVTDINKSIKIIITSIEKYFTIFFYGFSVFVLSLITQGVVLALANIFFLPLILLSCFISSIFALLFLKKTKKNIQVLPKITLFMILFTSVIVSIIIFFPHDTIGGRDESIFANLAIHLTNNHSLNFPQYLSNFSSNYTEDVRARLPAYTSWLGITYVLIGINGLFRSNVILIMLGLFSFFLTASCISNKKIAFFSSILFASTMPFLWFMRETMTENLSFFLLWFSILSLIIYLRNKNTSFLVIALLAVWIFSLTRIEGLFIQTILSIFIIIHAIKTKKQNLLVIIISCIVFVASSLLIIKLFGFSSYFLTNMGNTQFNLNNDVSIMIPNINQIQPQFKLLSWQNKETLLYRRMPEFIMTMLNKYNFVLILFSIVLVTFASFSKRKHRYHKKFYLLILLIILPEFYKIISPSVTLDQPWFYRRYLYALLPFGYLSFVILLSYVSKKILVYIVVGLTLMINIIFSSNILFLKNNWTLADKLEYLSKDILNDDLVIIRNWTLGYYYPGSYLIIQKGIKNIFVSEIKPSMLDMEKKIFNGIPYGKIFLMSTNANESYLDFVISDKNSINLSYSQLEPLCQFYEIGLMEKYKNPYNFNMIPYDLIIPHCSETNNTIKKHNEILYLYELSKK